MPRSSEPAREPAKDHRPAIEGSQIEIVQEDVEPFVFTFGRVDPEAERRFEQLCEGVALRARFNTPK